MPLISKPTAQLLSAYLAIIMCIKIVEIADIVHNVISCIDTSFRFYDSK
jgi:hypothetical protein